MGASKTELTRYYRGYPIRRTPFARYQVVGTDTPAFRTLRAAKAFVDRLKRMGNPFLESLLTGLGVGTGFALSAAAVKKLVRANPEGLIIVGYGESRRTPYVVAAYRGYSLISKRTFSSVSKALLYARALGERTGVPVDVAMNPGRR